MIVNIIRVKSCKFLLLMTIKTKTYRTKEKKLFKKNQLPTIIYDSKKKKKNRIKYGDKKPEGLLYYMGDGTVQYDCETTETRPSSKVETTNDEVTLKHAAIVIDTSNFMSSDLNT